MKNFHLEKHPIENGQALLAVENGVLVGEKRVHEFNLPLIPETWKDRIQEVRVQRAENQLAAAATNPKRRFGGFFLAHSR